MSTSSRRALTTANFAFLATAVFSTLIGVGLWKHEIWGDEYHAWALVLHSHSLSQLLTNLRGEGHLPFSYFVFYGVSRFFASPYAMQVVQFILAVLCAWIVLYFAPLKRWQKVLFLLGYFPLYEYGVISRSYTWDMLGLFGFCAVYGWAKKNQRKPWLAWVFLLILVTNESFGVLMALPLAGLLLYDLIQQKQLSKTTWIPIGGIVCIGVASLGFLMARTIPVTQWQVLLYRMPHSIGKGVATFFAVFGRTIFPKIHLPEGIFNYSPLKDILLSPQGFLGWILTISIAVIVFYLLLRLLVASVRLPLTFLDYVPIFTVWTVGFGLLFLFLWSSGGSIDDARHTGHYYLFFIACWWLMIDYSQDKNTTSRQRREQPEWLQHVKKNAPKDFRYLLVAHVIFGIFAYSSDFVYPFAANQITANWIESHHLQEAALVAPESVAIAMGRKTYFPKYNKNAYFIPPRYKKLPGYLLHPTKEQIQNRVWNYARSQNEKQAVVVIQNEVTEDKRLQHYLRWRSPRTINDSQEYVLYMIPRGVLKE